MENHMPVLLCWVICCLSYYLGSKRLWEKKK